MKLKKLKNVPLTLFLTGKFFLLIAFVVFSHDMLNYLEFGTYHPTTTLKLWQLTVEGNLLTPSTTGSTFFDTLLSSPFWMVFGIIGAALYVLLRQFSQDYN